MKSKGSHPNLLLLVFTYLFVGQLSISYAQFKEVVFNPRIKPTLIWQGQTNLVPCLEPFTIKIEDIAFEGDTIISGYLSIYNTTGEGTIVSPITSTFSVQGSNKQKESQTLNTDNQNELIGKYEIASALNNTFTAFVSDRLKLRRYYDFVFIFYTKNGKNSSNEVIYSYKTVSARAYTRPLKSEISFFEFYGGIGAVIFTQAKFKKPETNMGFATGLKIKLYPVSTNTNIGRFGLYPMLSRPSLVIGALLSEAKYKNTDIKASWLGLKWVFGLDFEPTKDFGITLSGVIGKQDVKSPLTINNNVVCGLLIGISLSTEAFQKLKSSLPANSLPGGGTSEPQISNP